MSVMSQLFSCGLLFSAALPMLGILQNFWRRGRDRNGCSAGQGRAV